MSGECEGGVGRGSGEGGGKRSGRNTANGRKDKNAKSPEETDKREGRKKEQTNAPLTGIDGSPVEYMPMRGKLTKTPTVSNLLKTVASSGY